MAVSACSTLGAGGPGSGTVRGADSETYAAADIAVVQLDGETNARIAATQEAQSFAQVFGEAEFVAPKLAKGDIVSVTLWEAPPAVLFGQQLMGASPIGSTTSQGGSVPEQPVDETGSITVPFVGKIVAAGRTTTQVQDAIMRELRGRANDPQVLVRLVSNQANTVTVMGRVAQTQRVPLSSRGERLLDVLAQAGGPVQEIEQTTVRIARGNEAASMPLDAVILDPAQNISLQAEDIVTVVNKPYSFIALGALKRNAEVPFEGSGISLAQALGRAGGLRDDRADIRGVFIFRFEDAEAIDPAILSGLQITQDGRVPVVYRLDLSQAAGLFVAQDFQIRDDDVLYVSSAPGADLQKFLQTLSNVALSTIAISNSLDNN
ncbi:polysaccharide biosynthesis/export family protein [Altererythrobacter lutimaris]|uniref:Polysaccharide export protein n=1 Tax=Altererythrobacter lutimaris TaxID=2743979 RepID=A0A850H6S3_9SPHN|nr:polysaccharide biosynthesis/export family protein [Altererythrobacter lutimaris]NVE94954.1 polysaccharide export protein [Altererythrobacter lutimaris]